MQAYPASRKDRPRRWAPESKIAISLAKKIRPSPEADGTTTGRRRAVEVEGREDDIGATEWMSRGLGTGRGMEGFVAVVVGKGGLNLIIILSSLRRVLSSRSEIRYLRFLDLM